MTAAAPVSTRRPGPDLDAIPFAGLALSAPAAEQIFTAVRAAILRMDLPPGCLLSETEVGQRFGASRTPVREAFTRLRADGLIVTLPSRGNFVTRLSEARLREAQFLREALEVAIVARLAETGLSEAALAGLHATLDAQDRATGEGDDARFQSADDAFHNCLAEATGFDRAAILLTQEKTALDRLRVLALSDLETKSRLLAEHRQILAAVRARDAGAASAATARHLRAVLTTLAGLRAAHAEYFE